MKITTKQITTTAVLLAICIVSQFFKNTSVYITGPIINACLIIAALGAGMACGIILSVITPVTSFLIPEAMVPKMAVFQTTFSVTQLITAAIGSVLAFVIWIPLKKVIAEQN